MKKKEVVSEKRANGFFSGPFTDRKAYIVLFIIFAVLCLPVFIKPLGNIPGLGFYFEGLGEYFATYYHPMRSQTFFSEIDSIGYYAYMPSLLLDHDLDFSNQYAPFGFKPGLTKAGLPANSWTIGPAILWAPFFLFGHILTLFFNLFGANLPADGFSLLYELPCFFGTIFYGFLGMIVTYWLCREFFSQKNSLLATIFTVFATPLVFYIEFEPSMSHALSYLAAVACVYFYVRELRGSSALNWALIGLFGGLATLIRVQCWSLVFFVLLTDLVSEVYAMLREKRAGRILKKIALWALCSIVVILAMLPQLLIWQYLYGGITNIPNIPGYSWSREGGGGNPYLSPKLMETLFSSCHGVFTWTPILVPALVGLAIFSKKKFSPAVVVMWLFFLSQVFFVASSDWTSGWAFGQRRIIETLFIAGIGGAQLLELSESNPLGYNLSVAGGFFFCIWNLLFIYQWVFGFVPKCDRLTFGQLTYEKFTIIPAVIKRALVPIYGIFNMW